MNLRKGRRNQTFALMAMVAFSSISICLSFFKATLLYIHRPPVDVISAIESRYIPLKQYLPAQGVVGYVSDQSDQKGIGLWRYYIVLYAMAPLAVARDTTHRAVIGDYHISSDILHPPAIPHHCIWRVFRGGLVIYIIGDRP